MDRSGTRGTGGAWRSRLAVVAAAVLTVSLGATPAAEAAAPVYGSCTSGLGTSWHPPVVSSLRQVGYAIQGANFDSDGRTDVLVAGRGGTPMTPYLGLGTGSLLNKAEVSPSNNGRPSIGDVDRDGDDDIVSFVSHTGNLSVWKSNGNGTFAAPVSIALGASGAPGQDLGDIDADGDLDVVVFRPSTAIAVFRNDGTGAFGGRVDYPVTGLSNASNGRPYLLDNDGDGDLDMTLPSGPIHLFENDGTGIFGSDRPITITGLSIIADWTYDVGDFDGDGRDDLFTRDSIIFGHASGFEAARLAIPGSAQGGAAMVEASDVNADGYDDAVTLRQTFSNGTGTHVDVYLASGRRSLCPIRSITVSTERKRSEGVGTADLNGDERADLMVTDYVQPTSPQGARVETLLQAQYGSCTQGPGTTWGVPVTTALPTSGRGYGVEGAKFNADSHRDILVGGAGGNGMVPFTGLGTGAFTNRAELYSSNNPRPSVGDVDRDGDDDIVSFVSHTGNLSVWKSNGDGTFAVPVSIALDGTISGQPGQDLGDIDQDGDLDVAVWRPGSGIAVFRNDGRGAYVGRVDYPLADTSSGNAQPLFVDHDGDRDLDLSLVHGAIHLRANDGTGLFGAAQEIAVTSASLPADWRNDVGDFDSDGKDDIFTARGIVFGSASGFDTTRLAIPPTVQGGASAVEAADVNGDGYDDAVTLRQTFSNGTGTYVDIYLASGPRALCPVRSVTASTTRKRSEDVGVTDLDADGRPDLVVTDSVEYFSPAQASVEAILNTPDRTKPEMTLSGSLHADRALLLGSTPRSLTVAATDAGSGVAAVELRVDGVIRDRLTEPCPGGGCSRTATFTTSAADHTDGPHKVRVVARDMVGNETVQAFDIRTDRTPPTVTVGEHANRPPGWSKGTAGPSVTLSGADPHAGVRKLRVDLPGAAGRSAGIPTDASPCSGSAQSPCPATASRTLAYDLAQLPQGVTTARAVAENSLGVGSAETVSTRWDVKIDRSLPAAALSGTLLAQQAAGGRVPIGGEETVVADLSDAYSGVLSWDVAVDGQTVSGGEGSHSCDASNACPTDPADKTFTIATAGLAYGDHTLRVRVRDAVGHEHAETRSFHLVPQVPRNLTRPEIVAPNGTGAGAEISTTAGTWERLGANHEFRYQWRSCDPGGGACEDIPFATDKKLRILPTQLGRTLRSVVVAVNLEGALASPSEPASSDPTAVVSPDSVAPLWLLQPTHEPAVDHRWEDSKHREVKHNALDVGLGLHRFDFTEPLVPEDDIRSQHFKAVLLNTTDDCDGTVHRMCPPTGEQTFVYETGTYREGHVHPALEAVDAAENRSVKESWLLKVDHTPPDIAYEGALKPFEGGAIKQPGTYPFTAAVTDGDASDETGVDQRSGVATVELEVSTDEGPFISQGVKRSDCTGDSCPGQDSYTVDTAVLGEGLHAIRVTATDRLYAELPDSTEAEKTIKQRHITTRLFRFFIDLEIPELTSVTHEQAVRDVWFNTQTLAVSAVARDASTGVREFALTSPAPAGNRTTSVGCVLSVEVGRCPQEAVPGRVDYSAADLPEGRDIPLQLEAVDAVDRRSAPSAWTVNVDRTPPGTTAGFRSPFDETTGTTSVYWNNVDDPFGDGSAGSGVTTYDYEISRNGGPPQTGSADLPMAELEASFAGEPFTISVTAVDAAGNRGATASATLTATAPPPDGEPPTLSLDDAEARYDGGENTSLLTWASAVDPDLSDGGPSAGISHYTATYAVQGGSPVTVETDLPRVVFPGGAVGQVVDLTVTAHDESGQASSPQSKQVTVQAWSATDESPSIGCAPTDDGVPPECNDPDDHLEEAQPGEAATLTPVDGTSGDPDAPQSPQDPEPAGSAFDSMTASTTFNLRRYRVDLKSVWTTARLRPGSYVIGNVRNGWTLDALGDSINGYTFGSIRGPFQGCGWIGTEYLNRYANDGTSNCEYGGRERPRLSSIAVGVNPIRRTDGDPVKLKRNQVNGVRFCAYITPAPDTIRRRHECGATYKVVPFSKLSDGQYEVNWRYVIRGRGWVMVRDPDKNGTNVGSLNWWFVRRSAFGRLCHNTVSRCVPQPGDTE